MTKYNYENTQLKLQRWKVMLPWHQMVVLNWLVRSRKQYAVVVFSFVSVFMALKIHSFENSSSAKPSFLAIYNNYMMVTDEALYEGHWRGLSVSNKRVLLRKHDTTAVFSLAWKHVYSNILKISPPKTEHFQIKILMFSYFCSKYRLWVLC